MFQLDILSTRADEKAPPRPQSAPFTHLALIGNALPRQCGMATYTSHVADALRQRYPAMRLYWLRMASRKWWRATPG